MEDPTWENFIGVLTGIALTVGGVAIAFKLWPVAVAAVFALIGIIILKNFDKIKKWFEDLQNWIETKFYKKAKEKFGIFGEILTIKISLFIGNIKSQFEGFFGGLKKMGEGVVEFFKGDWKSGLKKTFEGLKDIFTIPIRAFIDGINTVIRGLNKLDIKLPKIMGGGNIKFNIPQIPKLAKGGIINMPGRGVPVGNAIAGESGTEGVVPLTDTQQMALLGEAIGKYVRIDNVIDVNMDSRKIKRILAESGDRTRLAGNGYVR